MGDEEKSLIRRRAAAKGMLTRIRNQIEESIKQNLPEEVQDGLYSLADAVNKFQEAHENYHASIKDENELNDSAEYLETALNGVQKSQQTALRWLEGMSEANEEEIEDPKELIKRLAAENHELRELRREEKEKADLQQQLADREIKDLRTSLRAKEAEPKDDLQNSAAATPTTDHSTPMIPRSSILNSRQPMSPLNESSICQLLELSRQQYQSHVDSMRLPPTDLIKFDGEPLKYWQFMRLFSTVVDKETVPAEEKLMRLHQYTVGQARDAISHCLYNPDPSLGYTNAMATLKKRFGNPYTISQAWVDRVLMFKPIKDNLQLQSFADTLRSCSDTLKAMKCQDELSGGRNLLRIVEKLPEDLKRIWLSKNYQITSSGRLPTLDDVLKIVEEEAAKRADPIFGALINQGPPASTGTLRYNPATDRSKKKQVFSTTTTKPKTTSTLKCPKCADEHFLNQCPTFRNLTVQGRLAFVKERKLCFNCFRKGHSNDVCTRKWVCIVSGCGQKHNSWLHSAIAATTNDNQPTNPTTPTARSEPTTNQTPSVQALATGVKQSKIAMPIVPVVVSNPDKQFSINAFALLDSGSNGTFCSKALVNALKLKTTKVQYKLNTIDSTSNTITEQVSLQVEDANRDNNYLMKGVLCRDKLNISLENLVKPEEVTKWPHLKNIDINLADTDLKQVDLLIGLDQPDILAPREMRRGEPGDPYATLSGLGWALNGPVTRGLSDHVHTNCVQAIDKTEHLVERLWKLDTPVGIDSEPSITDKQVLAFWDQETVKEGRHYTLPIPFKELHPQLPANYAMAKRRLDLLGNRLKKDCNLQQKYSIGIHELLQKGYAEEVVNAEDREGRVWYLPHHPVFHPHKPDKLRIVFDCAARYQGTSLNDNIHQGPDLTNKLLGVLLRFRQDSIAISADIEGMFNQVKVPTQDRDVLRFLWWTDDNPDKPVKIFRMTTHLFGGVWSPSAATYTLQKIAEDSRNKFSNVAVETIKKNFYVDDCLKSVPTEDGAIALSAELRELLSNGGFRLTKWLSNSKKVMKSIPTDEWAKSLCELNLDRDNLPHERTLGVLWDVERDVFTFDAKVPERPLTKRGMLSATSSIYDPLGFASPFTLKAKALFQELCRLKLDWDERIPDNLAAQWQRWLTDLTQLSSLAVQRCLKPSTTSRSSVIQLHHFCDASELAYGAVSYIRVDNECRLIMAKAKLAPIKPTTIPRLELLAAVVATEIDQYIKNHLEIPISETFFWTDSTIVLHYINSDDRRFQTFVANRIAKIRERTQPTQWRHVNSSSNPADDASRGLTASELISSERWLSGPTYLQLNEENWPAQPKLGAMPDEAEVKQPKEVYTANINADHAASNAMERLMNQNSEWDIQTFCG